MRARSDFASLRKCGLGRRPDPSNCTHRTPRGVRQQSVTCLVDGRPSPSSRPATAAVVAVVTLVAGVAATAVVAVAAGAA